MLHRHKYPYQARSANKRGNYYALSASHNQCMALICVIPPLHQLLSFIMSQGLQAQVNNAKAGHQQALLTNWMQ